MSVLTRGKINLQSVDRKPCSLELDEQVSWVKKSLLEAAPKRIFSSIDSQQWADSSKLKLDINISRLSADNEYVIKGSLAAEVPTLCSRCGDGFCVKRAADFNTYVHLLDKRRGHREELYDS